MDLNSKRQEMEQLKKEFFGASDLYSQYVGGDAEVGQAVQKNIKEQYGYNQDLIGEENKLVAEQTTLPSQYAKELTEGRFAGNPILAGQAAAQQVANVQRRLGDIRGVRKEREGTIVDIINAVTAAYRGKTERMGAEADVKRLKYDTSKGEYGQLYQEEQDRLAREERARQDAEDKRRYEAEMALKVAELNKTTGSGGGGGTNGTDNLNNLKAELSSSTLKQELKSQGKSREWALNQIAIEYPDTWKKYKDAIQKMFYQNYFPDGWENK